MKKDYLFLALGNLKHRGLRSWLTILGIFIGIAAVVALISLGQGLEKGIESQFASLGKDKILIDPLASNYGGSISDDLKLTSKDVKAIEEVSGVEWVIGYSVATEKIEYKGDQTMGIVVGIEPEDYKMSLDLQGTKISEGRLPKEGDDKFEAVVGHNYILDKEIWDEGAKLGGKLIIEGVEFKIIGVIEKTGMPNTDSVIAIPKGAFKKIKGNIDEESELFAKVESGADISAVKEDIERKLRKVRNEKEGEETFTVVTSEQVVESFKEILGIVQAVLIGIALISLFVGGIGIMNTMYTSVLERTKEIGIMKAIGAKNSDVMYIFLFESGFLGLVGGIIGITLGIGLAKGVEYFAGAALGSGILQASIDATLIFGALAFSFLVGTLSGLLPAMRAAKLRPVEALRQE